MNTPINSNSHRFRRALLAIVAVLGFASVAAVSTSASAAPAATHALDVVPGALARPASYSNCHYELYFPGGLPISRAVSGYCVSGNGNGYVTWILCSNGGHAGYLFSPTGYPSRMTYTPRCYGTVTGYGMIFV